MLIFRDQILTCFFETISIIKIFQWTKNVEVCETLILVYHELVPHKYFPDYPVKVCAGWTLESYQKTEGEVI